MSELKPKQREIEIGLSLFWFNVVIVNSSGNFFFLFGAIFSSIVSMPRIGLNFNKFGIIVI